MRKLALLCPVRRFWLWAGRHIRETGADIWWDQSRSSNRRSSRSPRRRQAASKWRGPTDGDGKRSRSIPWFLDGVMYVVGKNTSTIVALDAASGKELLVACQYGSGQVRRLSPPRCGLLTRLSKLLGEQGQVRQAACYSSPAAAT